MLEDYFQEEELKVTISAFIDHYNNSRYHESFGNLAQADLNFGRGETILADKEAPKQQTIQNC